MAQLRIGDAERDAAVAALGEHYAVGRLTREEFDERAERASAARFDTDLAPLFSDLPSGRRAAVQQRTDAPAANRRVSGCAQWRGATPLGWLAPVALAALVTMLIITGLPWLLFGLLWFWLFAGFGGWHRRRRVGQGFQKSGNLASRGADWR